ncbi:hypothetical protein AB0467_17150 [Streptomyces sp. NPDC052095]|uniref:hypothetical protein n=1 Tax=unclassified Streptomyces TaxID=2593676 RepID=UPI00344DE9CB
MTKKSAPWSHNRGMGRILAQETNISDLIQLLSDRDPTPWADLTGFVPKDVTREARAANHADLLLTSSARSSVVEVKLGHLMGVDQQEKYESLDSQPDLFLAALSSDAVRLEGNSGRWSFLSLSDVVSRWEDSSDEFARLLATEAASVLRSWDNVVSGVFSNRSSASWMPLSALDQKFLGRVVTRRIARDLWERGRLSHAGVTSGGGLPIVQGWTPARGEGRDRTFIAEIRWQEDKPGGALRFGVDFEARPGRAEDEEVRRAAYNLARSMDADIEYTSLKSHLVTKRPELAELLRRDRPSRPHAKGDWEEVIANGFKGAPLSNGKTNNRTRTTPDFYGDGALRFQAIADVDFEQASATEATELIDATLDYLASRQP